VAGDQRSRAGLAFARVAGALGVALAIRQAVATGCAG